MWNEKIDYIKSINEGLKIYKNKIIETEALLNYEKRGIETIKPLPSEIIRNTKEKIGELRKKIEENYEIENNIEIKVSGVSYNNDDGSNRQAILLQCKPAEELELKQAPFKNHENAVKVLRTNGEQIGWISEKLSPDITKWLNEGKLIETYIREILDPTDDMGIIGCSIILLIYYKK